MTSGSFRRRKFLTYLGLGTVGLGVAITAQQRKHLPQSTNPNLDNQEWNRTKVNVRAQDGKTTPLPEFAGISTWLNSPPLTTANLQGKVVLVQIWTFACINCQRTLPYVTRWHQDYADRGLQIIGIHTPEFAFERDLDNVKQALVEHGIKYPVAIDNNHKMWQVYNNEYWPHLFLANRQGLIQYDHIGEGAYAETEQKIRELLG
jgi:thiol-disulfide isomerase/thioredoxin